MYVIVFLASILECTGETSERSCYHVSDPGSTWSQGTCKEAQGSSCDLYKDWYQPGTCDAQGFPYKCIGNYQIPFWLKSEDCKACTTLAPESPPCAAAATS
ncbi:hypothetical protein CYMTET_40785 [Cymbomonas tetramitiformis]|uniref:Secreted protein n=1 Tax=Cymbomonas tetramitiformis TaxID=36881 RepID=A0AAE0F372_9CHLO|nr:hypothetical protein CYMTET_40785 [Cymbomonas tetramitiformis]